MRPSRWLPILFAGLISQPVAANEALLLGILEDPQCYRDLHCDFGRDKACVAAIERKVRPLFARTAGGWMPLDSLPAAEQYDLNDVGWTIAFDGQNLGALRTIDPGFHSKFAWTYSRDFILDLRAGQSLPEIGNKDDGFGGWCDFPAHRPIVLVSRPNFRDPEKWKPFKPDDSYRDLVLGKVRDKFATMQCFTSSDGKESVVPMPPELVAGVTVANISFGKSYRDRAGRELLSVRMKPENTGNCAMTDSSYVQATTYLKKGVDLREIGNELQLVDASNYDEELQLVDAGDYDNDGQSELMFWYSGYDRDGYVLFYDDFRQRAKYLWSYH